MSHLSSNHFLSSTFKFQPFFCRGCATSKSTRLPFPASFEIKTSFPFQLVHSDVWQSPALSVSGYKYYLLFTMTILVTHGFTSCDINLKFSLILKILWLIFPISSRLRFNNFKVMATENTIIISFAPFVLP